MSPPRVWKTGLALFVTCVVAVIAAPAQTFTTLENFTDATGGNPRPRSLVQGIDGNLYGGSFLRRAECGL